MQTQHTGRRFSNHRRPTEGLLNKQDFQPLLDMQKILQQYKICRRSFGHRNSLKRVFFMHERYSSRRRLTEGLLDKKLQKLQTQDNCRRSCCHRRFIDGLLDIDDLWKHLKSQRASRRHVKVVIVTKERYNVFKPQKTHEQVFQPKKNCTRCYRHRIPLEERPAKEGLLAIEDLCKVF